MRKLRVTVTDENSILLDTGTIDVADRVRSIEVYAAEPGMEKAAYVELTIGAPDPTVRRACKRFRARQKESRYTSPRSPANQIMIGRGL